MPTKNGKTSNLIYESLKQALFVFEERIKMEELQFLTQKNLDR